MDAIVAKDAGPSAATSGLQKLLGRKSVLS